MPAHFAVAEPTGMPEGKTDYTPLALIFAGILALTALKYQFTAGSSIEDAMYDFMGVFFVVFAAFKLLDLKGFADAYAAYDLIAKRSRLYALLYPFLELALGIGYLFRIRPEILNPATLLLMFVSSLGVLQALRRKKTIQCACLGTKIKLPMTLITLWEDLLMAAMALLAMLS